MLTQMLAKQAANHPSEVPWHRLRDITLYDNVPVNTATDDSRRAIHYMNGGAFMLPVT